jgi:hypothetical protein
MLTYNNVIVNNYYDIIKTLQLNDQEELVKLLTKSINNPEQKKEKSIKHLYGAWSGDETADEIIEDIRNSRVFNRKIIEF